MGNHEDSSSKSEPAGGHSPDSLLPIVYDQLRQLAQQRMDAERVGHTLQATALVHEAYLRIAGSSGESPRFSSIGHFYRAAAEAMQRILVEYARARGAIKRGGTGKRFAFTTVLDLASTPDPTEILAFNDALLRLREYSADAAEIVRLRFFAGLSIDETAKTLGMAPRTVDREWKFARAWLFRELNGTDET